MAVVGLRADAATASVAKAARPHPSAATILNRSVKALVYRPNRIRATTVYSCTCRGRADRRYILRSTIREVIERYVSAEHDWYVNRRGHQAFAYSSVRIGKREATRIGGRWYCSPVVAPLSRKLPAWLTAATRVSWGLELGQVPRHLAAVVLDKVPMWRIRFGSTSNSTTYWIDSRNYTIRRMVTSSTRHERGFGRVKIISWLRFSDYGIPFHISLPAACR
ncbi:MAG TPA: hypothetical protein VG815_19660 [Chloroflexota bacterium]|nr:hypothetical protein [Chloroflexota bacterium]